MVVVCRFEFRWTGITLLAQLVADFRLISARYIQFCSILQALDDANDLRCWPWGLPHIVEGKNRRQLKMMGIHPPLKRARNLSRSFRYCKLALWSFEFAASIRPCTKRTFRCVFCHFHRKCNGVHNSNYLFRRQSNKIHRIYRRKALILMQK